MANWYGSGESNGSVTVTITETVNVGESGDGYEVIDVEATASPGSTIRIFYRISLSPNESP